MALANVVASLRNFIPHEIRIPVFHPHRRRAGDLFVDLLFNANRTSCKPGAGILSR